MEKVTIDNSLEILDCEYDAKQAITMILKKTIDKDGNFEYCCIRQSDPYIHPIHKQILHSLNNIPEAKEMKFQILASKLCEVYNLKTLDELETAEPSLFQKIKSVFGFKNAE